MPDTNLTSQVFTQAANFASAVSGGVDPRTGLFGFRISLGRVVGNNSLGPTLPLELAYSPLTRKDIGLGQGVSLGLTTFDRENRFLSLSTGEQYMVQETETKVVLLQHKLDSVRVYRDEGQGGGAYRVVHKSGRVEVLTGPGNAFSLKVPTAVLTPAGHKVTLAWDFSAGPVPHLKEVRDESDTVLLAVDYAGTSKVTLRVLPDSRTEGHSIELRLRNGLLGSVHHHGAGTAEPLVWDFTHTTLGEWGGWITGLTMPGGMSETAYYRTDGHVFPDTAGLPPLPCVHRFVELPGGGQPAVESSYDYTDTNFVGGYSSQAWDDDQDNVYDILTGYSYGSTETRTCGGRTTRTVRTYNQFHLQTEETTQQNGFSHSVVTEYYARVGREFADQPAQFQLPKTRTVSWSEPGGQRRSEVTSTEFDTAGNPTKQTDPDRAVTKWAYYDPKGEDGCPRDRYGFTRFLKAVTRKPTPDSGFTTPDLTTTYRYAEHPDAPDQRVGTVMLRSQEQQRVGDVLLTEDTYEYVTTGAEFGRLTKQVSTEYADRTDRTDRDAFALTHVFETLLDGDALVQKHTLRAHDGCELTRTQRRSRFTGLLWSATDAQKLTTVTSYDKLGRTVSRTVNPGTPYEAEQTWEYTVGGSTAPFTVTSTDALKNKVRESLDGAGRRIRIEHLDADGDGAWHTVQEEAYDEQGRPSRTSTLDQADSGPITLTRTFAYDDWGQLQSTSFNDGRTEVTRTDPVRLTTTTQLLGGTTPVTGTEVTTHNLRGETVTVERFGKENGKGGEKPVSTRTLRRDGWGRVRSEIDEVKNTTGHEYDTRGRLTLTTLPDGTRVSRAYERSSPQALVAEIRVHDVVYGSQVFDGLGRRSETTSGGRTWKYTYAADPAPFPSKVLTPDQREICYQYVPALGNALSEVQAGSELTQQFTHHKVTGLLTGAREGGATIDREYTAAGFLKADTTRTPDGDEYATFSAHTLGGLSQSYTGVDKTVQKTSRDAHGGIVTVSDPDMQVTPAYDSAGRVSGWAAVDGQGHSMTTALSLDDFGREIERTVTDSRGQKWKLTQTWQANDLLSGRILRDEKTNETMREETFAYDGRNRLTAYTCKGSLPPVDEHGNKITAQDFGYDRYGNLTTCTTTSASGSVTANHRFGNQADPCQLTGIDYEKSARPEIKLSYDNAGRLTLDEAGRALVYDALGRLTTVGTVSSYGYDPLDRLLSRKAGADTNVLTYHDEALASVTGSDGRHTRLLRLDQACVAQHHDGAQPATHLLATDGKQSVLAANTDHGPEQYAYTPYGYSPPGATASVLGYDGQWNDPAVGWLHLGNGYRAYHPVLMRFTAPDSASPFGAGGINPYAYCMDDPINRTDPTGHLSWNAWLGIGLGALAIGTAVFTGGASLAGYGAAMTVFTAATVTAEVASGATAIASAATESSNPKASSILGWVSFGIGLASFGAAAGVAVGRGVSRLAARAEALVLKLRQTSRVAERELTAVVDGVRRTTPHPLPENRRFFRQLSDHYVQDPGYEWEDLKKAGQDAVNATSRAAKKAKTAVVLRLEDGREFVGYSPKGNIATLKSAKMPGGFYEQLNKKVDSKFNWKCAEVDALKQAIDKGVTDFKGARSAAFYGKGSKTATPGAWREPCHGDKHLLSALGILW